MNTNSESTRYSRIKLLRKTKKDSIERKKMKDGI
jgi:hypothetical protein